MFAAKATGPAGPYSTEELIESRRAGRAGRQYHLLVRGHDAVASPGPGRAAGRRHGPAESSRDTPQQRRAAAGVDRLGIAGGLAAVGAVVAGAAFLWNTSATVKPPGAADRANLATQSRNSPVRDHTAGENHRAENEA